MPPQSPHLSKVAATSAYGPAKAWGAWLVPQWNTVAMRTLDGRAMISARGRCPDLATNKPNLLERHDPAFAYINVSSARVTQRREDLWGALADGAAETIIDPAVRKENEGVGSASLCSLCPAYITTVVLCGCRYCSTVILCSGVDEFSVKQERNANEGLSPCLSWKSCASLISTLYQPSGIAALQDARRAYVDDPNAKFVDTRHSVTGVHT